MVPADVICELGDPEELCGLENHNVLNLDEPWLSPWRSGLPGGLYLEYGGQRITVTAESFVANQEILRQRRVVAALFAGCAALRSSGRLASAARKVLAKAETLVIVHNRDYVTDLVYWFLSVQVLVLYHNLRFGVLPKGCNFIHHRKPLQLKSLIGSIPPVGMDHLFISPPDINVLVLSCPQLREVETPMDLFLHPGCAFLDKMLSSGPNLPLLMSPSLVLGMTMDQLNGGMFTPGTSDIPPKLMIRARKLFPEIRRLEVTTSHSLTVGLIRSYASVTDLSLTSKDGTGIPFQRLLEEALIHLHLEYLSLKFISDVSLSAMARNLPDLRSLSLYQCSVAADKGGISPGSFQNLINLRLDLKASSKEVCNRVMDVLLTASTSLAKLRLDGDVLCSLFVTRCRTQPLPSLHRVTLATDKQLPRLELTGDDLCCLVDALPSLRYSATDSYDIRLFFQHYMPTVTIGWCHCTTCAAEFPRLDDKQNAVWMKLNA